MENRSIRLVSTGKEGVIFNGLSDWLYEGMKDLFKTCTFVFMACKTKCDSLDEAMSGQVLV